jgi:hypothetical protein
VPALCDSLRHYRSAHYDSLRPYGVPVFDSENRLDFPPAIADNLGIEGRKALSDKK